MYKVGIQMILLIFYFSEKNLVLCAETERNLLIVKLSDNEQHVETTTSNKLISHALTSIKNKTTRTLPLISFDKDNKVNDKYNNKIQSDNNIKINSKTDSKKNYHKIGYRKSNPCLLGTTDDFVSGWVYPNGSLVRSLLRNFEGTFLDFSYESNSEENLYEKTLSNLPNDHMRNFIAFSAACNQLTTIPEKALHLVNSSLIFLTLRGNNFYSSTSDEFAGDSLLRHWGNFPSIENLQELDISNCSIDYIHDTVFHNLPNLQKLYLSHNKIFALPGKPFSNFKNLRHLDLSYMTVSFTGVQDPALEPYLRVFKGLQINETLVEDLTRLELLDLSYTKISPVSTRTFSHLPSSVEYLSLCFTSIPIIPKGMFANTSLKAIDISGNPSAAIQLDKDAFQGLEDTLEILSFEKSNVEHLRWLRNLKNLKILILGSNNINSLSKDVFANLKHLKLLDLSSNHIGNWYNRVFESNRELSVINLRDNNINIVTSEMYKDFSDLIYIGLGQNNFICNCILRDLIEIAAHNNKIVNCTEYIKDRLNLPKNSTIHTLPYTGRIIGYTSSTRNRIISKIIDNLIPIVNKSYQNMLNTTRKHNLNITIFKHMHHKERHFRSIDPNLHDSCDLNSSNYNSSGSRYLPLSNGEKLKFRFQLLDYDETSYFCFNSTTNVEHQFSEIEQCFARSVDDSTEEFRDKTHNITIGMVFILIGLVLSVVIYYKWWYIRYFFIVFKNSTILTFLDKHNDRILKEDENQSYAYDIFVSYCDDNRDWVLEELLPNIEKGKEITVCLHERDFQVGLSILDNIISCMDRSRCLMLVVSKNFLLSQWCQFELHLAQHRLFETRKEHLILVLLEEIPKNKQPKTLHYLMQIKTYIKWPIGPDSKTLSDNRKLFWKRLRKSLQDIEWINDDD